MGTFGFKYRRTQKAYIPVYPIASTVGGMVNTTDVGSLCVSGSSGVLDFKGGLPIGTTADTLRILGIITVVPENTTAGSTVPFYIAPITQGDIIEAQYSTTVEASTGTASVIASTNIGMWLGLGKNTTSVAFGAYIDPSLASTAPGTTNSMFFKMLGFSSQNDTVWGVINSSHLAL